MADSTDVVLQLARKQWSSALIAEDRVAWLTNTLLIVCALLQGFVLLGELDMVTLSAAIVIVALGVYGGVASRRYTRRQQLEMDRFDKLARRLDELHPDAGLVTLEAGPLPDRSLRTPMTHWVHGGLTVLGVIDVVLVLSNM